ncbi:MTRF1L release factor glutamine methyltransferase isoform X2 [Clupea harengus]|uniref:peptide chain release factor N(5)-glutamine methyltransferase n=1 Tax=Clupea harengus TaxID=7950 RepID=A0A8M1KQ49_CLUHA|nr:MTRF1L release factor glutamine methyltransferase isoform X2 [Clupea harengus]
MVFRLKSLVRFIHSRISVTTRKVSTTCGEQGKVIPPISARFTVEQALSQWAERFQVAEVPEPQLSSQYIISHVLGHKTLNHLERRGLTQVLSHAHVERIWRLCNKRLTRMPVQYVIEEWDFRDITLKMKPPVFIPRPETEELVSLVLADLEVLAASRDMDTVRFLEVGCGSGAISLSLLHSLKQIRGVALDQSAQAVALTRENAQSLGLLDRLKVSQVDVFKDADWLVETCSPVEVLVSNPPYLFTEDLDSLEPEVRRFEDRAALDGGKQGHCVIDQILALAPRLLTEKGRVYLEVDPRHPDIIQTRLKERVLGLEYVKTHYDFTNRARFCILQSRSRGTG